MKKEIFEFPGGVKVDWETVTNYMDDDLREQVHAEMAPCSEQEFFEEYCKRHKQKFNEEFIIN